MSTGKITVSIEVDLSRVADLLSCAFESGDVGYWCRLGEKRRVGPASRKTLGKIAEDHDEAVWLPLTVDGGIEVIEHNDSKEPKDWSAPVMLDLAAVKRGLALMAMPENEHAHHFGDWLKEGEDMTTGDVFL